MEAMTPSADAATVETAEDICALPLVRRLAAMLDRDPAGLAVGDPLPHGWHVTMFNPPTPQAQLRHDGAAGLGVDLPDIGLPRLMMGGRQVRFAGAIPIGATVRRESRRGGVRLKEGRSGRFALIDVEHRIFAADANQAAIVENTSYVLREAAGAAPVAAPTATPERAAARSGIGVEARSGIGSGAGSGKGGEAGSGVAAAATRRLLPDEALLFRYSAITDNPHRIHYDQPYASGTEGYPALVVNGSLPLMFLLEMHRAAAGREARTLETRNLAPMFCGRALLLSVAREGTAWRLWAEDEAGRVTFEARAQ